MPNLRELREKAVLSQRELAKITGLSATTINRIEMGKSKPIPRTIRALAKALKVKPADLSF